MLLYGHQESSLWRPPILTNAASSSSKPALLSAASLSIFDTFVVLVGLITTQHVRQCKGNHPHKRFMVCSSVLPSWKGPRSSCRSDILSFALTETGEHEKHRGCAILDCNFDRKLYAGTWLVTCLYIYVTVDIITCLLVGFKLSMILCTVYMWYAPGSIFINHWRRWLKCVKKKI